MASAPVLPTDSNSSPGQPIPPGAGSAGGGSPAPGGASPFGGGASAIMQAVTDIERCLQTLGQTLPSLAPFAADTINNLRMAVPQALSGNQAGGGQPPQAGAGGPQSQPPSAPGMMPPPGAGPQSQ